MLNLTKQFDIIALCISILIVVKPVLSEVHSDCGGMVEVGRNSPQTITYKLNENYDADEQCVWTVRLQDSKSAHFIKTESAFELRYDFIQLSSFTTSNLLLPQESRTLGNQNEREELNMTAPVIFVVFSTDGSNGGTGFNLEIEAFGDPAYTYVATDFFTDERDGNYTLRPYFNNMMSTWVITANEADSLDLDINYDTESFLDVISIFHVERNGGRILFFPYGLLTGQGNRYYTLTFYTTFVVLFTSDGSILRYGFDLNWKAYGDGSGTTDKP